MSSYGIMWYIIIILSLVYWFLYKIVKEYSWSNFNKIEGCFVYLFIMIKTSCISIIYKIIKNKAKIGWLKKIKYIYAVVKFILFVYNGIDINFNFLCLNDANMDKFKKSVSEGIFNDQIILSIKVVSFICAIFIGSCMTIYYISIIYDEYTQWCNACWVADQSINHTHIILSVIWNHRLEMAICQLPIMLTYNSHIKKAFKIDYEGEDEDE